MNVKILAKAAKDLVGNCSKTKFIETGLIIDNKAPEGDMIQEVIGDGKVLATIWAEEDIQEIDGWTIIDSRQYTKIFPSKIIYDLDVIDFAGNVGKIEIDINQARNIILTYGAHHSEVGWTFKNTNYTLVGKDALKENPNFKIESLVFNISGNIEKDFVQAQGFVYDYWKDSQARCTETKLLYKYGYNPSKDVWNSMNSSTLATIKLTKYFQIGGAGLNSTLTADINGKYLPGDLQGKYLYGISGIRFKLKSYKDYSIVYQIFVNGYGWNKTCKNEEWAMQAFDKPMGAMRMAITPNSEVDKIIETWDKDFETNNM